MSIPSQYHKKKYINLQTYRKNGEGVRTPVWFVEHDEKLYVITMADSWKVKRIRRENRVQVAPCQVNGRVIGEWQIAEACETNETGLMEIVNGLYRKKYGLLNRIYEKQRIKKGNASVTLEIKIIDDISR